MVFEFFSANKEFLVFIIILTIFLYIKRKNLEVQGKFPFFYILMYKTKLGLGKMDLWSKKHPKVFLFLSYLSIFIGVIGLFFSLWFMVYQLGFIVEYDLKEGGGLVLPIKTESGSIAGIPVVAPPFFEWFIALMILVIVHEFAHGVIAERFKIKIKSSGFAFMGLIAPLLPAAFVEPDEKYLKKAKWWQQIAVFGAGSTSNFIFGGLFLLIFFFVANPFMYETTQLESISFTSVMNESSLKNYGIESGEIIALNYEPISNFDFIVGNGMGPGMSDLIIIPDFYNFTKNQTILLTINTNNLVSIYEIQTFQLEEYGNKSMIGISGFQPNLETKDDYLYLGGFPKFFQGLIFWIALLNIGIGLMNLLPIWITDGGQIAKTLLANFIRNEKIVISILNWISLLSLIMIIFIMFPALLKSFVALF
ncbi:MAG: site-2 protease family protein [Nanoarchaeota archaeon]|nr:site-2 protease family protein [Nanoarchaeota archaeon]